MSSDEKELELHQPEKVLGMLPILFQSILADSNPIHKSLFRERLYNQVVELFGIQFSW